MIFRLLATLAQFERELVSERTRAAMSFKKTNGERVGKIPFGYSLAADGKQLLPDRNEQSVLSEIMKMHAAGKSQSAIARELNSHNIPSKSGGIWRQSSVRGILKRNAVDRANTDIVLPTLSVTSEVTHADRDRC
jgi:DNA invertase Pin-like site-specific DNA recombinase